MYAYLLAKFDNSTFNEAPVRTFDFISVQFYEGWSRANAMVYLNNTDPALYMQHATEAYQDGWMVDFASLPEANLSSQQIVIDRDRLIIGLANGWAGPNQKFFFIWPKDLATAHNRLRNQAPRGYMFWVVLEEGRTVSGTNVTDFWLSSGLNDFVGVRTSASEGQSVVMTVISAIIVAIATFLCALYLYQRPFRNTDEQSVAQQSQTDSSPLLRS